MAVIYATTMSPGKLDLLAAWLPTRPWYIDSGRVPQLRNVGGFRLDDPEGEVGLEFMMVTDGAGPEPVTYHLPLTYRGEPLDGGDDALIGTSTHGVLGQRWIYDGSRDPVSVAQTVALLAGWVRPQAQHDSETPDTSIVVTPTELAHPATDLVSATDRDSCTEIVVGGQDQAEAIVRVHRIPSAAHPPFADTANGQVSARWRLPDHASVSGVVLAIVA